jgi:transcriptional regulator with XRE-family HTH domain
MNARQEPPHVHYADLLRTLRSSAGMTQEALAKCMTDYGCRWSGTTVAKIETGGRALSLIEAAGLSRIFDVSIDAMVSREMALKIEQTVLERRLADVEQQLASGQP